MAVNVFRHNPPRWAPIIQETYGKHKELDSKNQKALIDCVKKMEKMPAIAIDEQLNDAVRKNNASVTAEDVRNPKENGNIEQLKGIDSGVKVEDCQEVTMVEYLGQDADEFITLVMIKCWNNPAAVKDEKVVEEKKPEDPNLLPASPFDEKPVEATKPKEEPPKQKVAENVDPRKRCPLFEPLVTKMGMSNKAHKYRKNVIQLLFRTDKQNEVM